MNNSLVRGSLGAIARQENKSLAETFLSCDVIVIVDVSGSMAIRDSRGGQSRYDVACEELAKLQATLPGKIAVIAFSSYTQFCPGGQPFFEGGGTDLAGALQFTKVADVPDMRFIVISDGQPDSEQAALKVAKTYKNRIDTIFVGPERDMEAAAFLARLAQASGGKSVKTAVKELEANVRFLLEG